MSSTDVSDVTEQLAKTKVDVTHELSFKGRGLKLNTPEDAKEITDEMDKCQTMTALRMEGNTLGVDAAAAIAKSLEKHPEFTRAHWSDMFTGRLKSEIPKVLEHLGSAIIKAGAGLVELDLSDNAFGPNGVVGLVSLLKSSSCYTLQELKLNNNGLGIGGGKMLAESLQSCHESSLKAGKALSLKVFISGRNRLENEGATALASVFKSIGTLEHVAMPQNGINHPGITALADAFSQNKQLKILNLNDNTFTQTGAKSMAKVLSKLENLEVINFGDCLVRSEGAIAIAKAVKEGHQKLKELNLSGNEINKVGANAVADTMENKPNLIKLDLNCNMLGEEGIEEVRGTMEAIGKLDILASLSDDEGSDDENEETEGDGEEEEVQEDEDGEIVDDPHLQVKGKAITPQKQSVTAKDFLAFPSPTKLLGMGTNRASIMKEELGTDVNDIEKVVQTYMRISSIVTADDEKTITAACDCIESGKNRVVDRDCLGVQGWTTLYQLFEESLKSNDENAGILLGNTILVYLGILKGEDKKYKPPSNITGPILVLEHIVKRSYFPKFSRDMILAFCSRPHPQLDGASQARHKLLQTLYTF